MYMQKHIYTEADLLKLNIHIKEHYLCISAICRGVARYFTKSLWSICCAASNQPPSGWLPLGSRFSA